MTLTLPAFVANWKATTLSERSSAQPHFLDLCEVLGERKPAEVDPQGTSYTFEKGVSKVGGGQGFADVWKDGCFAWEYKGKHKDLAAAYNQLLQYREDLKNPPLLVVCDLDRFQVHTNFTGTIKHVYAFTLDDLLNPAPLPDTTLSALEVLRAVFASPERLRPQQTTSQVTEKAAREFAKLAESLRKWGHDPEQSAHFLMRLLFCLFAEDIGLLPSKLFTRLVEATRARPKEFTVRVRQLFGAMASGGSFGPEDIAYFNGGLFEDSTALELTTDDLMILSKAAALDWSSIEPAIFGTLFERSLDPSKRSQLGAHYTGRDDILLIVEPVLMEPLRRRWLEVKTEATELVSKRDADRQELTARYAGVRRNIPASPYHKKLEKLLTGFLEEVSSIRVLDPACGSGNFLYVALKLLLDLEKEVYVFAGNNGVQLMLRTLDPSQLYGIELNDYAHALASVVVWIGYIQWLHDNGFGMPSDPVLKPLHNILHMDAILAYDEQGKPVEPEWPEADVIVGNPPFLGDKKMRSQLGHRYVEELRALYAGRVPSGADLVMYWFERAREKIDAGSTKRAGLLATNSIRQSVNRKVVDRIKQTGDIFMAWSDRDWVLEGAAVNVSMLGFDDGSDFLRSLDGSLVTSISADLHGGIDFKDVSRLRENSGIAFIGDNKKRKFYITIAVAQEMLASPINTNLKTNASVIRRWVNGSDVARRSRGMWIIDFGVNMSEGEAMLYEKPYDYVRKMVKPDRDQVRNPLERTRWWLHGRTAPDFRGAVKGLDRYIGTSNVAKHRTFTWLSPDVLPDHTVTAIVRSDDYFFGILQSKPHVLWSLRLGSTLENRPVYTASVTFETFPFPWPPGKEPKDNPRMEAIAEEARKLVVSRDRWLNPEGASEAELKKRTLTKLYNEPPPWLDLAHKKLDQAVFDTYGWPHDLTDEQILERLLALNLERANGQEQGILVREGPVTSQEPSTELSILAQELVSQYVTVIPSSYEWPRSDPNLMHEMRMIKREGLVSVKLVNLLHNLPKLGVVGATSSLTASLGFNSLSQLLILVFQAVPQLYDAMKIKITEVEASVMITIWQESDPKLRIQESGLLERVNRRRKKADPQMSPLSKEALRKSLDALADINAIRVVLREPKTWELMETLKIPLE